MSSKVSEMQPTGDSCPQLVILFIGPTTPFLPEHWSYPTAKVRSFRTLSNHSQTAAAGRPPAVHVSEAPAALPLSGYLTMYSRHFITLILFQGPRTIDVGGAAVTIREQGLRGHGIAAERLTEGRLFGTDAFISGEIQVKSTSDGPQQPSPLPKAFPLGF